MTNARTPHGTWTHRREGGNSGLDIPANGIQFRKSPLYNFHEIMVKNELQMRFYHFQSSITK